MPDGDQVDEKLRMFGEIDRFVKIKIEGEEYEVPADMELLRCFQYLDFQISFEYFCWNANCENCVTRLKRPGAQFESDFCCQTLSEDGIEVEKLPVGVEKPKK